MSIDIEALKARLDNIAETASWEGTRDDETIRHAKTAIEQLQAEIADLTQAKRNACSMLDKALEQNEGLKEALSKQAKAAISRMDAAKRHASSMLGAARIAKAESSPEAIESERSANAILTAENEALQAEVTRLNAVIADSYIPSKFSEAQMGNAILGVEVKQLEAENAALKRECNVRLIQNEKDAAETDFDEVMRLHKENAALRAENEGLKKLFHELEKTCDAEHAAWNYEISIDTVKRHIDAAMEKTKGE